MRTIAIANQKGGCGKTTTAISLAWELSNRDRRTLVVDMDPQGHIALGFGLDTSDPRGTLFSLLLTEDPVTRLDTLLCEVEEDLFVVPSTLQLTMPTGAGIAIRRTVAWSRTPTVAATL